MAGVSDVYPPVGLHQIVRETWPVLTPFVRDGAADGLAARRHGRTARALARSFFLEAR